MFGNPVKISSVDGMKHHSCQDEDYERQRLCRPPGMVTQGLSMLQLGLAGAGVWLARRL